MKNQLFFWIILIAFPYMTYSQGDVEGCKDYPMFNRMPNFYITGCIKNFDAVTVWMSGDVSKNIEGNKTEISYELNTESGQQAPSFLQVVKNFENAIAKYNGKRIYLGSQDATLHMKIKDKDFWIIIESASDVAQTYKLLVLEVEPMKQEILANEMFDGLTQNGSVSLYINFETGKSDIKPESQPIIDQMVEMLKANPSLKISIEGHTDNIGTPAANKTLSENRAKSVMNALTAKSIDKTRLTSRGWGQEKPIEDNESETGRAKNRRVEIIKQ